MGGLCTLSEDEQIYSKICVDLSSRCPPRPISPPGTETLLPVWLSISAISVRRVARWARLRGGMPSSVDRRCSNQGDCAVLDAASCAVADPALQQIQSDSRNWVKCDHYSRTPPNKSWNVHQESLYLTQLFLFGPSDTLELGEVDWQEAWSCSPFFLFLLSLPRPLPCWLSPFLSLQFISVIGTGHCEGIGKAQTLIRVTKMKDYFIAVSENAT